MLRRRGRLAFYTILVPRGLTAADHRRARRRGPPAVATSSSYHGLLASAGFVDVDEVDVTTAYLATAQAWLRHGQEHAAELASLVRPGELADRLARRRAAIDAIEAGLLRRSLFVARRPVITR